MFDQKIIDDILYEMQPFEPVISNGSQLVITNCDGASESYNKRLRDVAAKHGLRVIHTMNAFEDTLIAS